MPLRRTLLTCCACVAALVAAPAAATPPAPTEQIAAGVSAAGVDLSGLTIDQAVQALEPLSERIEKGTMIVQSADLQFKFQTSQAEAIFDTVLTARRALYAGREAAGRPVDVPLAVRHSQKAVEAFVASISKRLRREPRDAGTIITLRRVRVTHSRTGRDIYVKGLAKKIGEAVVDPRITRVFKARLRKLKPKVNAHQARRSVGTVITIDQSAFKLRLFKKLKVVKTYKVAVGMADYPTPNGRFAIQSKQIDPVWSVPNSPWAGELAGSTVGGGSVANPLKARWMGITGSVGIHGTSLDYSIGTRASHGCIRMHVPDVKLLYKRVPVGTPVLIAP